MYVCLGVQLYMYMYRCFAIGTTACTDCFQRGSAYCAPLVCRFCVLRCAFLSQLSDNRKLGPCQGFAGEVGCRVIERLQLEWGVLAI